MKYTQEKKLLREFLSRRGVRYDPKEKTWQCPAHHDETPSAVLYKNNDCDMLHCPVCSDSWSIFEVCGFLDNVTDFKDKLKNVRQTLSIQHDTPSETQHNTPNLKLVDNGKPEKKPPVFLEREAAKKFYNKENIIKLFGFSKRSKLDKTKTFIVSSHPFIDQDKKIMAMDVRFEDGGPKKEVLTFWFNGKSLKFAAPPILIYGKDRIDSTRPHIIHEGVKCAELGQDNLTEFNHLSWSGGSGKAKLVDWSPLKNCDTFILYDNDEAGRKAAIDIKKQLPHAKMIKPPTTGKGDDIEQFLQKFSSKDLTEYILNDNNVFEDGGQSQKQQNLESFPQTTPLNEPQQPDDCPLPFKILGIGDDGKAAFITEEGRFQKWNLDGLSKNKLVVLTSQSFYFTDYPGHKGQIDWDGAIDDIIRISQSKDFNENNVRGRGAWRDGDNLSYHDGVKTVGKYDKSKIYLRLPKEDIGINDTPAAPEIREKIKIVMKKVSFETPADMVRCLAWSVLAPFAGALKYRPALLLTGPSGSGKSTVANICIRRLANCEWFNGSESTVAGVRGKIKYDSKGVMFEEAEKDTDKKANNRAELLSLMRVNVSDDAPDTVKGTKDGGYNSFKMQNMFGFIAIDPTIDSIADENRIFRINMVKPKNQDKWNNIENEINNLMTDENCRAIRALTWNNIKKILDLSQKIVHIIRKKTKRDYRSSFADAMLASTFIIIWKCKEDPDDEYIEDMLNLYYSFQSIDEHRDEAQEMVDRLMDETIEILNGHEREKLTIRECINIVHTEKKDDDDLTESRILPYKQHLSRYGIKVLDEGHVAIANNSHMIKRILNAGTGYSKMLKRHPDIIDEQKPVYFFDKKTKRCTVLDILEADFE